MEEILASIRRIIADDDAGKAQGQAAESGPAAPALVAPARAPAGASASALSAEAGPASAGQRESAGMSQTEVDAMLSDRDQPSSEGDGKDPSGGPETGILELTEDMAAGNRRAAAFRTIDPDSDVIFSEAAAATPPPAPGLSREHAGPSPHNLFEEPLLSSATNAAVDSAFNALARTVLVDNSRTLEDLVRELLRPMLKSWLDDNLPGLVERLVRAEIERVSRGRV